MIQKIATKTVFSLLIASLSLCGCDKEPVSESGHVIRFSPCVGDISVSTKSVAKIETEQELINSCGSFTVSCWMLTESLAEAYFEDETVSYNATSGEWEASQSYMWPENTPLKFVAYANAGSGISEIDMNYSSSFWAEYSTPNDEENQTDLLVGAYYGTGTDGTATISFVHPMTNVIFNKGSIPDGSVIESLTISGVMKNGKVNVHAGNAMWESVTDEATFTKDFSSAPGTELAGYMFIPQAATMTISVSVNGETAPFTATTGVNWSAGKCYTYTLNIANPEPGDHNLTLDVSVQDMVANGPVSIVVE